MLVVAALGGNALLRRGEPPETERQRRNLGVAADALAELAAEHALVATHGNGPQVGLLALQAESYPAVAPPPLDVLGAESEGMIGYLLEQELRNRLPGRQVATLLTQVEVDPRDPAFANPTKPIGPVYARAEAERLAAQRGWRVAPEADGFRRVVPSPEPRHILEIETIRLLVGAGAIVVCAGGGGIPVACQASGACRGVEAVIDKDLAAAQLATALDAEALLLLTDVDAVYREWGPPGAHPFGDVTPSELRRHVFPSGSMGPKVEGACRFVEAGGGLAGIGALADARRILLGEAGTRIRPEPRLDG